MLDPDPDEMNADPQPWFLFYKSTFIPDSIFKDCCQFFLLQELDYPHRNYLNLTPFASPHNNL
jgi:hypothetical protein